MQSPHSTTAGFSNLQKDFLPSMDLVLDFSSVGEAWSMTRTTRSHAMSIAQNLTVFVMVCVLASMTPRQASGQIENDQKKTQIATPFLPLVVGDTVLIADAQNETRENIFDRSLKQALVIELEQSPFFSVLPESKVRTAMKKVGEQAPKGPRTLQITDVCIRLGGRIILRPEISAAAGLYRITLTAIDCATDQLIAKATSDQGAKDEVLQLLTVTATQLREHLGEPSDTVQKYNVPVGSATSSLEALAAYGAGLALQQERGDAASAPLFEKAVEADSLFPQPHAALASVYRNLRLSARALASASRAFELRDRVNERAKLRIQAAYFSATGRLQDEIQTYQLWEKLYPRDSEAHSNLGNAYFNLGNLQDALTEYRQAVQLSPTVVDYSNLMGAELSLNHFADVQQAFDNALADHVDGRYVRQTYYWLSFIRGNQGQMEEQVRWAAGKSGDEEFLLSLQSDSKASYGQMRQARALTQRAVNSAIRANSREAAAFWQVNSALREAELGNGDLAERAVHVALQIAAGHDVEIFAALTLARCGRVEESQSLVNKLESSYATDTLMKLYWLPTIRAAIALSTGDAKTALEDLEATKPYELGGAGTTINYLYPAFIRGEAYLAARRPAAAISEFQKLLDHPGIVLNFVIGTTVHIELGRALMKNGDYHGARHQYEAAFALCQHADNDLPILQRAHSEYSRLSGASRWSTPPQPKDDRYPEVSKRTPNFAPNRGTEFTNTSAAPNSHLIG